MSEIRQGTAPASLSKVLNTAAAISLLCIFPLRSALCNDSIQVEAKPDNRITIQASNASLKDVLLEVQFQTGILVNFVAENTQRVTVDISNQPLEAAIRTLTPNHMVIQGLVNGKATISELIIISDDNTTTQTSNGESLFLPSGEPAPLVLQQEDESPEDFANAPEQAASNEPIPKEPITQSY